MRRTLPAFSVALGMLALSASGCPIWIDEHGSGGAAVCIGEHCSCRHHADCDPGEACVGGECVPTGNCFYEPCPSGYVCDTWGTCVPEATVTCDEDVDCEVGYCDLASETCVHTGLCTTDDDCRGYGGSFVCDGRACVDDPDGGGLCTYSSECAGGLCVNGYCITTCSGTAECGAFETCQSSMCLPQIDRAAACTAGDCAGGLSCVDGVCRMPCAADVNCTSSDPFLHCWEGFCRTENEIANECHRQVDCFSGLSCVDGACL